MDDAREEGPGGLTLEVFDPAPVGVAVTSGPDHRLVYTNVAYRTSFGERALGQPIREAFGELLQQDYFDLFDRVLATGEAVSVAEAPVGLSFPGAGAEERFFSFSLSRFDQGEPGVLAVAVDVTEQITAARRASDMAETRRRLLRRFQSLVQVSAEIVWVTGPEGGPIEPSPGWERVTGQPWEEFRGEGWLRALHPDDREPTVRSWGEALRLARPWRHVYRLRTADGYRHFDVRAAPVYESGRVVEWVGTCTDVEQRWQGRRREELLGRAALATAEHADLQEMLGALADVLVPALADGCGVHLLPDFAAHPESAPVVSRRVATAARPGLPPRIGRGDEWFAADSGFVRAVRGRRPLRRTFPPGEPPPDLLPRSTETWLAEAGAHSVVLLPVVVDGSVAAVVTASACGERPPMGRDDVGLMGQMFDHAHDALSGALRYQRAQRVALALQHGLLADPPEVPGLGILARYRPSPAAAEVGGDWYDSFVLRDGGTALVIGDVAGHDLAAAVGMSRLRNMLRGLAVDREEEPPGEVLRRLNIAMDALTPDSTATCVLGRVEGSGAGGWRLTYAAAGHPPPLLVTSDRKARLLEDAANPLLGLLVDQTYASATEPLPPGSTLLLYTDGLVEHPDEHLDKGLARLCRRAAGLAAAPLPAFCDGILTGLPTAGTDDIAVIALRVPDSP